VVGDGATEQPGDEQASEADVKKGLRSFFHNNNPPFRVSRWTLWICYNITEIGI